MITIFIIELGIWVIRASGNFIQVRDVFWRLLATVENDDVSTKFITIFIIELGIWVILASGNFIRGCHVFWRLLVTIENGDLSTKLIIIFIIELGIWAILASGNLGCNGRTFLDSGGLQRIMMMFQQILLQFSSLSLVYGSYEQVAIWGAMEGRFLAVEGYYE